MRPGTETEAETLAWVHDDRAVRAFLQAPHHGRLKSRGNTNFYYDQGPGSKEPLHLRGLTDPLRERFWSQEASSVARKRFYSQDPDTIKKGKRFLTQPKPKVKNPDAKRRIDQHFINPKQPPPLVIPLKKNRPKGKSSMKTNSIKAMRQGTQVHRQIDQVAKLGVNEFLDANETFHPYVLAVILALHVHKPELRILHTEYLAGCPTLGIATRIDIVCVDQQGRIYIVENKTGSPTEHSWSGHNGRMQNALQPYLGNSAHNRAKVQAIAGAMMAILGTQLELSNQVRCLVSHVNDEQVTLELVPDDVTATLGPLIYEDLLQHQRRRKLRLIKQEAAIPTKKWKKAKTQNKKKIKNKRPVKR